MKLKKKRNGTEVGNPLEERKHMGRECEPLRMCASFIQAHMLVISYFGLGSNPSFRKKIDHHIILYNREWVAGIQHLTPKKQSWS